MKLTTAELSHITHVYAEQEPGDRARYFVNVFQGTSRSTVSEMLSERDALALVRAIEKLVLIAKRCEKAIT